MRTRLNSIFLIAALVLGLSTLAAAQMVLDLDTASGDQGVRETVAKPGEMKTIDLVAIKGAKDIVGFEVELAFDGKEVIFKGFKPGGIMAGAMTMPPQTTKDGAKISAALLGKTCKEERGTLGQILIELAKDMGAEVHVKLVKGSYGAKEGTKSFQLQEGVKLLGADAAPKTTAPAVTQPPPPPPPPPSVPTSKPGEPPEPPVCDDNLRNSELKPQAENVPCGKSAGNLIFRTVCAKPPYDTQAITLPQGRMAGCFGVEAITRGKVVWGIRIEGARAIYSSTLGPTVLKRLRLTDKRPSLSGKYTIYLDTRRSDPDARVTVRFVDHPIGGGPATPGPKPPGPPPADKPGGPPTEKPGRGPASTPPGQQMGPPPGAPPMGPPPDPEEIIKSLPAMLQPIYKQTLDVEKKTALTHMNAELELQENIFKTLGATKMLLPRLSDEEKEKVAQALAFFSQRGPEGPPGPPMGPPPGKPGRGPASPPPGQQMAPQPGGPPMGPPEEMVQRMIDETQRIIIHIKQELAQIQGRDM